MGQIGESSPCTQASGSGRRCRETSTRKPQRPGGDTWPGKSTSPAERGRATASARSDTHPPFGHPKALRGGDVCGRLRPAKLLCPTGQPQWFLRRAAKSPDRHARPHLPVPRQSRTPSRGIATQLAVKGGTLPKQWPETVGAEARSRWPELPRGATSQSVSQAGANPERTHTREQKPQLSSSKATDSVHAVPAHRC